MRLTDKCQLSKSGSPVGGPRPCEFGHVGGQAERVERDRLLYTETARVIVGPDPLIAGIQHPAGWQVTHKGKRYTVTGVLPRYRPGGRLHHVSLDLETVKG